MPNVHVISSVFEVKPAERISSGFEVQGGELNSSGFKKM